MKILSLFDGISIAQQAFKELGVEVEYYASEIDKQAISITQKNHPNTEQLGDIKDIDCTGGLLHYGKGRLTETDIYFLIGGSPCQDLSIANKNREGLKGCRSGLFYEMLRLIKEVKPKYFILENVNSMPKEAKAEITKELWGIEPAMINAALVSAQNRKRLFWVGKLSGNIYVKVEIPQPEDKGILLKDIAHETREEKFDLEKYIVKGNNLTWITDETRLKKKYTQLNGDKTIPILARQYASWNGQYLSVRIGKFNQGGQGDRVYSTEGKSVALSAMGGGRGAKTGLYLVVPEATKKGYAIAKMGDSVDMSFPTSKTRRGRVGNKAKNLMTSSSIAVVGNGYIRKLTPVECCRLQSIPDNTTDCVSDNQAYKALGNGFNCAVIKHIIKSIL